MISHPKDFSYPDIAGLASLVFLFFHSLIFSCEPYPGCHVPSFSCFIFYWISCKAVTTASSPYRSRWDSGQKEAERTNSAIGDSRVDGSKIDWNFHKRYDGLSDDEIAKLTPESFQLHEKQGQNVKERRVTNIIWGRIHDGPVMEDFINAILGEKQDKDNIFWNKCYLKMFQDCSVNQKSTVPGSAYIEKILSFIKTHYNTREYLFQNYLVKTGKYCSYCSTRNWTSPEPMKRISQPVPDPENSLHYKSVDVTPTENPINGKPQEPDDFQPRTNIWKKKEDDGQLSTKEEIQSFAKNLL